ncbi:MAG: zinc-finger domain-containing protein [Gammaproteobacteria bacterium]
MSNPASSVNCQDTIEPNAENRYEITAADVPLHCPLDGMSLWNSHPKVFLPIDENTNAKCPYCGAEYILKC